MTTKKSNLPAPIEKTETAVATWEGFESDGTEDIQPTFPMIKIVQGTSSWEGSGKHAGEFYRTDTETYHDPLVVVPLLRKRTRAIFTDGNNTPVCRSDDGYAPVPRQPLWDLQDIIINGQDIGVETGRQPSTCDACPFSRWSEDGTPPACRESDVVLVDQDGDLAQLRFSGKSLSAWTRWMKRLKARKMPLCSQRLTLTTVERSEPGRKWHELEIMADALPHSEAVAYNAVLAYERSRFEQAVRDSHEPNEQAGNGWEDGNKPIVDAPFVAVEY